MQKMPKLPRFLFFVPIKNTAAPQWFHVLDDYGQSKQRNDERVEMVETKFQNPFNCWF